MTGCVVTRSFGSCMTPVRFGFSETASAWVSSAGAPRAFSDMSRWRWPRTTRGNRWGCWGSIPTSIGTRSRNAWSPSVPIWRYNAVQSGTAGRFLGRFSGRFQVDPGGGRAAVPDRRAQGRTGGQDRRSAAEAGSRSGRAWPVARAPPAAGRRRHPPDPPIRADPVDRVPPIASAARRPHTW